MLPFKARVQRVGDSVFQVQINSGGDSWSDIGFREHALEVAVNKAKALVDELNQPAFVPETVWESGNA